MKFIIKYINFKYYIFIQDSYMNLYDTMNHFDNYKKAINYVNKQRKSK